MVTKEKNPKVRQMIDVANFVGKMTMWIISGFKIWKP
jgi:hypothetical protein